MNLGNSIEAKPEPLYPDDLYPNLNGFGGWFVFVIIGRFVTIIIGIYNIATYNSLYMIKELLGAYYSITIGYSIVSPILLSVVILYFIFKRNIIFRKLLVIQLAADFIFVIVSIIFFQALVSSMGTDVNLFDSISPQHIGSFVGSIVWTIYLFQSKRIKNTFIYAHQYPDAFKYDGYTYSER